MPPDRASPYLTGAARSPFSTSKSLDDPDTVASVLAGLPFVALRPLRVEASATLDAKARGVELSVSEVEPSLEVYADRQLLTSAAANLVQNAVKFTGPGRRVALTVHRSSSAVVVNVEDECGGLAPGVPERLFTPFEGGSRAEGGLGLGLSIAREAARANGGELKGPQRPRQGLRVLARAGPHPLTVTGRRRPIPRTHSRARRPPGRGRAGASPCRRPGRCAPPPRASRRPRCCRSRRHRRGRRVG